MAQLGWLLKVLAGSHAGAELQLNEAEYLLGGDEQCDLVFSGEALAGRHLQIQLSDDAVHIKRLAMDHALSLDGKQLEEAEVTLHAFQVLGIGSLRFALAPVGAEWPSADELLAQEAVAADHQSQQAAADNNDGEDVLVAAEQSAAVDEQLAPVGHPATGFRRHWLRVTMASVLLAGSGFLLYSNWSLLQSFFSQKENLNVEVKIVNPIQEIKKIITQLDMDLHVRINPDGRLRVYGYVKDDEEKNLFLERIQTVNSGRIDNEIKTFAAIKRAVRRVLSSYLAVQDQVDVVPGESLDRVVFLGYVVDENRWRQALDVIRKDITDIRSIDNRVETLGKRLQALQDMLLAHGFKQTLFPKVMDGRIILEGHIPNSRLSDWDKLNSQFDKRYNGMPQLVLAAEIAEDDTDWLSSFQVDAVVLGKIPYFVLRGQKYIIGSRLDNGYTVERIDQNSIRFQSGERHYTFYFGEGADDNKDR